MARYRLRRPRRTDLPHYPGALSHATSLRPLPALLRDGDSLAGPSRRDLPCRPFQHRLPPGRGALRYSIPRHASGLTREWLKEQVLGG